MSKVNREEVFNKVSERARLSSFCEFSHAHVQKEERFATIELRLDIEDVRLDNESLVICANSGEISIPFDGIVECFLEDREEDEDYMYYFEVGEKNNSVMLIFYFHE